MEDVFLGRKGGSASASARASRSNRRATLQDQRGILLSKQKINRELRDLDGFAGWFTKQFNFPQLQPRPRSKGPSDICPTTLGRRSYSPYDVDIHHIQSIRVQSPHEL